jgi:RNA polymerase sigma-70 factor (ECF subfamily)
VDGISEVFAEIDITGGRADFETVFLAQYARIARVVFSVIQDAGRAEELAVEVFIRWSRLPQHRDDSPDGWLYRTAIRIGLDELRHRARQSRYEALSRLIRPSPTPEEISVANQEQKAVRQVLGSIRRRHAELLLLRNRGLSYGELASALSLNPASVGTLLSRAQNAFRKEYIRRYGEK